MPRYRFSWSNLPQTLLQHLSEVLDIQRGEDVVEGFKARYGSRPNVAFIEDTWELLRETWLSEDEVSLKEIASTMREHNLGKVEIKDDLEYLRSCRNTINMRRVVLPTFISLGEPKSFVTAKEDDEESGSSDDGREKVGLLEQSQSADLPKKISKGIGSSSEQDDEESGPSEDGREKVGVPEQSQSADLPKKKSKGIGSSSEQDDEESRDHFIIQSEGNPVEHFRQWLLKNLKELDEEKHIEPDDDGDIPVDFGSARTYVSPRNNPLSADIYSILLENVSESPELLTAINKINCETPFIKVKYLVEEKQITLHHEVMAEFISTKGLAAHLNLISRMADSLDTELQRSYGGSMHGADNREDEQDV